jgi:hypothetical protein
LNARGGPEVSLVVASVLARDPEVLETAVARLGEQIGGIAFASETLAFPYTEYYGDELGPSPARRIVSAPDLLEDPSTLPDLKRTAGRLEVSLARPDGRRQANIDPGYLNIDQLVLASTKRRAHRVYLGRGVYADLMLLHRGGGFEALPWTYPDYASAELRAIFDGLRGRLLEARRGRAP